MNLSINRLAPIIARCVVYATGFLFVIVLSRITEKNVFGLFSIYQSILEVGVIICTLGLGGILTKESTNEEYKPPFIEIIKTLAIGFILYTIVFFTYIHFSETHASISIAILCEISCFLFSASIILLSILRGKGRANIVNSESAIRNGVAIIFVILIYFSYKRVSVEMLILSVLIGMSALLFVLSRAVDFSSFDFNKQKAISWKTKVNMAAYSIFLFVLRKSDVLVFSSFMPMTFLANYKLAFLLSEAPSQFSQAFYVSKTKTIASGCDNELVKVCFTGIAVGIFFMVMAIVFVFTIGPFFNMGSGVKSIMYVIIPYHIVRCYTVFVENYMLLRFSAIDLKQRSFIELVVRLALFYLAYLYFGDKPHVMYIFVAVFEVFLYELYLINRSGKSFLINGLRSI